MCLVSERFELFINRFQFICESHKAHTRNKRMYMYIYTDVIQSKIKNSTRSCSMKHDTLCERTTGHTKQEEEK